MLRISNTKKLLEKIEDFWIKRSIMVCVIFGILSGTAHYYGLISNIRSLTSNVVTFASIVIGVTGVFLTLLITLKESPVFERLKLFFPQIQVQLYINLRNQINYGLIVVILSIVIYVLPPSPNKLLASIGVGIWSYFFWTMSLGSFYSVKLVTDLIIRNVNIPTRTPRS